MRLLDEDRDTKLDRVTIYLTRPEAEELMSDLRMALANPKGHHAHISSEDFQKEITVCIYDNNLLGDFNERSKRLIKDDV